MANVEIAPPSRTTVARRPSHSGAPVPREIRSVYIPNRGDKDVASPLPSLPPSAYPSTTNMADLVDSAAIDSALGAAHEEERVGTPPGPSPEISRNSSMAQFDIDEAGGRELPSLPPVDRGAKAWSFLAAATLVETVVWGLPFSAGVLHEYWMSHMFPNNDSTLTMAATLQTSLMYMSAAFLGPMFTAIPQWSKPLQWAGLIIASASLVASAFVTQAWHLIVTIGIFYPFAGALYLPCATLVYEWFHARRGMATGIQMSGTGVGGVVYPLVVSALLSRFGYKATMISLGLGFFALNAGALVFIRRRIPLGRSGARRHRNHVDYSFLKHPAVWIGMAVIMCTCMGNFIPSLWIPTFADVVHARRPNGTALVAIMNAASVPGNAVMGYLSDRYPSRYVVPASCTTAALACLLLWGFSAGVTAEGCLTAFAVVWGFTALSFVGLWSKMITVISKDDPHLPGLLFSLFTILKGVGNLTSGPISTALLKTGEFAGAAGAFGKTNYGSLLIYTGVTTFGASLFAAFFPKK